MFIAHKSNMLSLFYAAMLSSGHYRAPAHVAPIKELFPRYVGSLLSFLLFFRGFEFVHRFSDRHAILFDFGLAIQLDMSICVHVQMCVCMKIHLTFFTCHGADEKSQTEQEYICSAGELEMGK
jgi:hypothetical protein